MLKVGLFTMFVAAVSFAAFDQDGHDYGTYKGKGVWEMPGKKGTWTSVMQIEKADQGAKISEKLTVHEEGQKDHVEESSFVIGIKDGKFFDLIVDGKNTGWGHCFDKLCQTTGRGKTDATRYGETLHFEKGGKIYRLGHEASDEYTVVWKGLMVRH